MFLKLVRKHFLASLPLSKNFNKHAEGQLFVHALYSLPGPGDQQKVLAQANVQKSAVECNCRVKSSCPLDGRCSQECAVYQAAVTTRSSGGERRYFGLYEKTFKTRHGNHLMPTRHERYCQSQSTRLSKHLWALQDQCEEYDIG